MIAHTLTYPDYTKLYNNSVASHSHAAQYLLLERIVTRPCLVLQ